MLRYFYYVGTMPPTLRTCSAPFPRNLLSACSENQSISMSCSEFCTRNSLNNYSRCNKERQGKKTGSWTYFIKEWHQFYFKSSPWGWGLKELEKRAQEPWPFEINRTIKANPLLIRLIICSMICNLRSNMITLGLEKSCQFSIRDT